MLTNIHTKNKPSAVATFLTESVDKPSAFGYLIMENLENEIWKDVLGYEGLYQVSNLGNARSLPRKKTVYIKKYRQDITYGGKILKPSKCGKYWKIDLCKNNVIESKTLHRLVAQAFIPNPENKPCVNHIDGDGRNNNINNLEWATYSENELHSYRCLNKVAHKPWLNKRGAMNPSSKPCIMMSLDGGFLIRHESATLAKDWLIKNGYPKASQGSLCNALMGIYKSAYGYKWEWETV